MAQKPFAPLYWLSKFKKIILITKYIQLKLYTMVIRLYMTLKNIYEIAYVQLYYKIERKN